MAMTIQCDLPDDLIRALQLVATPSLRASERELAVNWLQCALVDFNALDKHITLLQQLYKSPFCYPRPRRDCWSQDQVLTTLVKTKFRFTERLDEKQLLAIIDGGPRSLKDAAVISDEKLGELLLNPFALHDLFDVIDEILPDAWLSVMNERGKELASKEGRPLSSVSSILPTRDLLVRPRMSQRWVIGAATAMAACLLLAGVFIDRILLRQSPGSGSYNIQVALRDGNIRGQDNEDLRVEIHSNLDGFAIIVALTQGQRQELIPSISGDPIQVKPGEFGLSPPLPTAAAHASTALVIVTETPADGSIRRALRDRVYGPEQIVQLQADLQKQLEAQNYRNIGFTRIDLKSRK